ncbi:integrase/recombinase [Saccharomonospora azurea SZMC 14600]|uniref:tyrosine-type recombinase/integrase n=1 Tax=Saccharomonospora azurea TaxID=40988 RepID=UPI00023FF10F|nr:tyrosine-type recombinase/integrase [Saccharomonospora azurea]EHK83649.1 integrase/recombinase [Saccharomonospora azurea SZMC 14600]
MTQTEIVSTGPETAVSPHAEVSALAALDAAARDHVDGGRRANTVRAYASDRKKWNAYCAEFGIPETTLSVGTAVGFVEWLIEQQAAPRTIERRVSGARKSLREDGVDDLDADDRAVVAERLRQYKRALAETGERRGRGQARAITVAELRKMSLALPDTLLGLRDRALLLVGFAMAARRAELAGLWAADVELCDEGLCLTLRTSKTSDEDVEVAVPYGTSEVTCPVRAWQAYRNAVEQALGHELDGKAFRRIDRHGRVLDGMSAQGVGIAVTRAAEKAGLPEVTAHGLRAGLATEARRAGHDVTTIAQQGRWSPSGAAIHGYMRVVDQWSDNAVRGIGL